MVVVTVEWGTSPQIGLTINRTRPHRAMPNPHRARTVSEMSDYFASMTVASRIRRREES